MGAAAHNNDTVHSTGGHLKITISFIFHQIFATWGVIFAAPWVLILLGEIGQHFGSGGPIPRMQWLLYGTPYFPAYILIAFVLGWLLSGWLQHRSMLWVWALPLVALCVGVARYPQIPRPSYITTIAI